MLHDNDIDIVILILTFWSCLRHCFRYSQFDPYDRPQASLGYNMDDSEFANDYGRPPMDDSYNQLYSQQHANGHSGYCGYGNW